VDILIIIGERFIHYAPLINLTLILGVWLLSLRQGTKQQFRDVQKKLNEIEAGQSKRDEQMIGLRRDVNRAIDHIFKEANHTHDSD
jgi:hypothetical protein